LNRKSLEEQRRKTQHTEEEKQGSLEEKPRKRKPHIIPALLSSPERNQSEQKKTKKTSRKEKDHPESTNTVIGFPFYSASFHSHREKLKRRGMSCWRKGTQTEGERTEANQETKKAKKK